MTEKRNTDWTDKLRERLSDSELSPSADVWSKVESATPARKSAPAAVLWGLAVAAAAVVALLLVPRRENVVNVAPDTQQTLVTELENMDEDAEVDEQTVLTTAAPEATAPVAARVKPGSSAPVAPAVADPLVSGTVAEVLIQDSVAEDAEAATESPAAADSPAAGSEPAAEYCFGTLPEEIVKARKKAALSLFASGIPGNSGLNSRPELYIAPIGASSGAMGSELSMLNSIGNNTVVFVNNYTAFIAKNADGINDGYSGIANFDEYLRINGYEARHHRPVSVGVTFTYPLVRNIFLESGLSYTFLRSEYTGGIGDQRLHFLGVPLKLGYRFNTPSSFSVALSAGAMAEKCICGELFGSRITVREPQFSAVATASVYYNLGQQLSLFVAPDISYYFTSTSVPTYRTERPMSITLRLGVNLNLGK